MEEKEFWFRLTKIDEKGNLLTKPDFTMVKARSAEEADSYISEQLKTKGYLDCNYFTEHRTYQRRLNPKSGYGLIAFWTLVSYKEVQKHIDRCFYAMEHA